MTRHPAGGKADRLSQMGDTMAEQKDVHGEEVNPVAGVQIEHEPGTMDIAEQERTFAAFLSWTTRIVIGILVALILLYIING